MSTQTTETIVEKVRSILDRANHPNTPPAEAETALALAQRLITKYSLDESALRDARQADEEIVKDKIVVTGAYALRRLTVLGVVAWANSCAIYRSPHYGEDGYRKKNGYALHLYGTEADIFATKIIWQAVEALALRTIPKGDRSFRHSWWVGFASGVQKALRKANSEAVAESGSSALVLADRRQRAEDELRAKVSLRKVGTTTHARRSDAYYSGQTTGASFSTGGIGRGAIGALGR